MLPSMPLLMTPVKELGDDSSDTSDDSPFTHHSTENGHTFESNPDKSIARTEDSDQLLAVNDNCPVDSSSDIASQIDIDKDKAQTPEKRSLAEPSSAQKKKKKTLHKKTVAALTPDTGTGLENSALSFAEAYFQKVRSEVDDEKWAQFVQELVDFEEKTDQQPAELYRRMDKLLKPHTQLVDEFLGFLLPHQALQVNRFIPYLLLVKMKEFFRKMNILLMKRQARQVISALESVAAQPGVGLVEVKEKILPLLKSSPMLTNLFLELLPGERPPDSLMTDFEKVDLKDDSKFETITIPESPDPYGSENCVCTCHSTQKNRHCITCGIKYLNGRVYLQHGKVLRPAKVIFKGKKHLDLRQWEGDKYRSRRRLLPKTMLSPNFLDHRLNADSEDDCGVKKSPRTPRIRAARPKVCKKGGNESKEEEALEGIFPLAESKHLTVGDNLFGEVIVDYEMKQNGNDEHEFDDIVMENEGNTEEDEEEDLNKCLHSENESSLEAEDIVKDLESGNDYSFEDEEMEDIENVEANHNELAKVSSDEEGVIDSSTQILVNSTDKQHDKSVVVKTESQTDNLKACTSSEKISSLDKQDSESTRKHRSEEVSTTECQVIKSEEIRADLPKSATQNDEDVNEKSGSLGDMKTENNGQGPSSSSVKVEEASPEEPATEGGSAMEESGNDDNGKSSEADSSSKEWTREEDKIILQTFQHENELEQTFEIASLQLPNRSKEEIRERFEVLLKVLKEMISDESNCT